MPEYLAGVDIGGTKCAVVIGRITRDDRGVELLHKIKFPTDVERGPGYAIDAISRNLEVLLRQNPMGGEFAAIGISCGGPLDAGEGVILSPPNLPGWDGVPIAEILEKRFGVTVRLQNDANACALAEWQFGSGRGSENFIFLTFGTGMGAGMILGGRLYRGSCDMAGEIGHVRMERSGPVGYGKMGSFEGFCSGGGIAQLARMRILESFQRGEAVSFCPGYRELDGIDTKVLREAADAGDSLAAEIFALSGNYLGRGLALLVDLLNPQVIAVGSVFDRCRRWIWPSAEKVLKGEVLERSMSSCHVVAAELGEEIGDYAALGAALYE